MNLKIRKYNENKAHRQSAIETIQNRNSGSTFEPLNGSAPFQGNPNMPNSYLIDHPITSNGQLSTSQKLNYTVNLLKPQFLSNTNKAISNQDSTTIYYSILSQLVLFLLYHTFLATQTHPQIQNPINPTPLSHFPTNKTDPHEKKSPQPNKI